MSRYRTVLFDADNTLLDFDRSEREALIESLAAQAYIATDADVALYSDINKAFWKKLEQGEIEKATLRRARFDAFCAHLGCALDTALLSDTYTACLATKSYLTDGAFEVCRALASHCRLYIITNGIASVQNGRFEPSPLRPFFSGVFISEEIGTEKPHTGFFNAVARGIPAFDTASTLVVGDSLTSDMAGGIRYGLDTCWYNPKDAARSAAYPVTYEIRDLRELLPLVLDK